MKRKIWYKFSRAFIGLEALHDRLEASWKKVRSLDTELFIKSPTKGTAEFEYSIVGHMHANMLRTVEMVEGVMQAEREGFDGAVIGCFGDPGLDVLEALVDIPVMGPVKAAINDGADMIILGCVNCSTVLTYEGISNVEGVPIVDGAIASLKLVELLA